MKFLFLVEDYFGQPFFERFFSKKANERIFSGKLERVRHVKLSGKITRQIKANIGKVDRIIIIADADGGDLNAKNLHIARFIDNVYAEYVKIVLLDYEIEEWICHSEGIKFNDQKPSNVLKHKIGYEKYRLPEYAEKMDCVKLQGVTSFKRFASSLE